MDVVGNSMGLRVIVEETTRGQRSRWVGVVVVLIGRGMVAMAIAMNHRPSHRPSCCRVGGSALPDPFCGSGLGGGVQVVRLLAVLGGVLRLSLPSCGFSGRQTRRGLQRVVGSHPRLPRGSWRGSQVAGPPPS